MSFSGGGATGGTASGGNSSWSQGDWSVNVGGSAPSMQIASGSPLLLLVAAAVLYFVLKK